AKFSNVPTPVDTAEITPDVYLNYDALSAFKWDSSENGLKAPLSPQLQTALHDIPHTIHKAPPLSADFLDRAERFKAVKFWFDNEWRGWDDTLRTSIAEGVAFFLEMFDANQRLKRIFSPPKEAYENPSGKALPPLSQLIETGAVVAVNFPAGTNAA